MERTLWAELTGDTLRFPHRYLPRGEVGRGARRTPRPADLQGVQIDAASERVNVGDGVGAHTGRQSVDGTMQVGGQQWGMARDASGRRELPTSASMTRNDERSDRRRGGDFPL